MATASGPAGRILDAAFTARLPTPGRVSAKYSQVPTLVTPLAADVAAAEQDLVGQVAAWFGLGGVIAVKPCCRGA